MNIPLPKDQQNTQHSDIAVNDNATIKSEESTFSPSSSPNGSPQNSPSAATDAPRRIATKDFRLCKDPTSNARAANCIFVHRPTWIGKCMIVMEKTKLWPRIRQGMQNKCQLSRKKRLKKLRIFECFEFHCPTSFVMISHHRLCHR